MNHLFIDIALNQYRHINTNNINSNKLEDVEKDAFTESFRDGYDQKSEYSNNDSSSLASSSSYNHNNNNNNNFNHNRNRNLKDEVNWNQFLKSLETNYALPKENFNYENSLYRTDTLNSSWHGHERLSTIFNIADENSKNTLWKRLFYRDLESSTNNDANTNPFTTSKKDNEKLIDNNNNNSDENINNNNNGNKKIKNNNVFSLSPEQIESYKKKASFFFSKEARKNWNSVLLDALISNSYIPLFFRIFIVFLSSVALGLASRIIVLSGRLDQDWHVSQQPSTVMAVVVDTVAIVYLFYIAYDEFTGQPIGLRNPHSKITLAYDDQFLPVTAIPADPPPTTSDSPVCRAPQRGCRVHRHARLPDQQPAPSASATATAATAAAVQICCMNQTKQNKTKQNIDRDDSRHGGTRTSKTRTMDKEQDRVIMPLLISPRHLQHRHHLSPTIIIHRISHSMPYSLLLISD
ncbi:unnamed protein product [[Candida] boidinii]|uniref:Unnamed protein product n=1 Tax=Candida boidinii TaxID=5477 RepID=A0ACB5TJY8_CANBO|nr:unnamed protein product [[Candida] boidinii]